MSTANRTSLAGVIETYAAEILAERVQQQLAASGSRQNGFGDEDLREESRRFLHVFRAALPKGSGDDVTDRRPGTFGRALAQPRRPRIGKAPRRLL